MDLKELRIGNIVGFKNRTDLFAYVTDFSSAGGVHLNRVFDDGTEDDQPEVIEDITPIKLTDYWLLKFGFKKEDKAPSKEHGNYFSMWWMDYKYSFAYAPFREDYGFYHSYTDACKDEDNNKFDFISCEIRYVHDLQNLLFALTKTELVLKERGEKV